MIDLILGAVQCGGSSSSNGSRNGNGNVGSSDNLLNNKKKGKQKMASLEQVEGRTILQIIIVIIFIQWAVFIKVTVILQRYCGAVGRHETVMDSVPRLY